MPTSRVRLCNSILPHSKRILGSQASRTLTAIIFRRNTPTIPPQYDRIHGICYNIDTMKVLDDNVMKDLRAYAEEIRSTNIASKLMQGFLDYSKTLVLAVEEELGYSGSDDDIAHSPRVFRSVESYFYNLGKSKNEEISKTLPIHLRFRSIRQFYTLVYKNKIKDIKHTELEDEKASAFLNSFNIYYKSNEPIEAVENEVTHTEHADLDYDELEDEGYQVRPIIPFQDRENFLEFHKWLETTYSTEEAEPDASYRLTFDRERTLRINGVKIHDVNRGSEAHRILMQAFKNGGRDSVMDFSPRIRNLQQTMLNIGLPKDIQGLFFPVLHDEGGNFHNPVSQAELKKAGLPPLDLSQFEKPVNV